MKCLAGFNRGFVIQMGNLIFLYNWAFGLVQTIFIGFFRFFRDQAFHFAHDVIMGKHFATICRRDALGNYFNLPYVPLKVFFDRFVH
jgi:hypothetical protein